MDKSRLPRFEALGGATIRKRRTYTSRRPKPEPDSSPVSTTQVSDEMSDEIVGDANSRTKMFNLNQCVSRSYPVDDLQGDGRGSDRKLKKVKLKVGGVTRTIQAKSNGSGSGLVNGASVKSNQSSSDTARSKQMPISPEISEDHYSSASDKKTGLQGIPWKDFSKGGYSLGGKEGMRKIRVKHSSSEKQADPVRKSKRAPKRRALDGEFDEDDDDEIRYLEKLKSYRELESESGKKRRYLDEVGRSDQRDAKSFRSEDMGYEDQAEEVLSDEGKKKKQKKDKDLAELAVENKQGITLTTRQRALLTKDALSPSSAGQIEFPNGLPPPAPRKQKEKLTEVEQQLKKAEAAQRRRMQNEKAAQESEQEAIRKILGQDSGRKKREEQKRKRMEELAQEKAANAELLASNTVRCVIGPNGTTVTFPQDMGLPKFFDSNCSYPPPRENCSGPSCTNPYRYRDSKSNLPLCSLRCYKAINS